MNVQANTTISSPVRRVRVGTMLVLAVLLSWTTLSTPVGAIAATAPAPTDTLEVIEIPKNGWLATGEVVGLNLLIWSYDRYIREGGSNPGFRIGTDSWQENLNNGFEWDDNNFKTNQFAHPYHGSLYFNAARSNGFGYWGSLPFSLGGSLMWEYMMEVHHPAFNDWIATGIGGAALGESFHRLSGMILDNTATGGGRVWREIGGFVVNPMGGLNRLISGRSGKVYANPEEHYPSAFRTYMEVGSRTIGEGSLSNADTTRGFVRAAFAYGDPFQGDYEKPFDTFSLDVEMNFGDKSGIGHLLIKGLLMAKPLKESETSHHLIGVSQHYDYVNNNAYEMGGQSFSATYLSRIGTHKSSLATQFHADAVILGASKSDYADFTGREYSYGPGLGFKLNLGWQRHGRRLLTFGHTSHWIFVVDGDAATHYIATTNLRLDLSIYRTLGLGAEYLVFHAERDYRDFPDVSQVNPEARFFVNWFAN